MIFPLYLTLFNSYYAYIHIFPIYMGFVAYTFIKYTTKELELPIVNIWIFMSKTEYVTRILLQFDLRKFEYFSHVL
jgi:hypothetical protein